MAKLFLAERGTGSGGERVLEAAEATTELGGATRVRLRRVASSAPGRWVVLAAPGAVTVNGVALVTGLRVLRHRDALRAGGATAWFSAEGGARVGPMPAGPDADDEPVICPRCQDVLEPGTAMVRCPRCGVAHHESAERPCWTYGEECAACGASTAPDAPPAWRPEDR